MRQLCGKLFCKLAREGSLAGFFCPFGWGVRGIQLTLAAHFKGDGTVSSLNIHSARGFTFIELLVVLAAVFVMLAGAHSWLANHNVRAKIAEALSVAEPLKTGIVLTCMETPGIEDLESATLGHAQPTSYYVESIMVHGSCRGPLITIQTANTGLLVNPTVILSGNLANGGQKWMCSSTGLDVHTPTGCDPM